MKISIITVCLNASGTIGRAIQSVSNQDHEDIEYIIVDGGSSDDTDKIIADHQNKISKFISENDKGIYDAMNKGIALATGDVIAMLNSDDEYVNNSVVSRMAAIIENNKLDAAYADLYYVKAHDPDKTVRCWQPGEYKKGAFGKGWSPPHPTFFCRKEVYQKYGGYLDSFKIAADFELMLRLMEKYSIRTGYLPEVTVKMRTGGKANRIRGIVKGNMEILKAFRINQIPVSPLFFCMKPVAKLRQLFDKKVNVFYEKQ